MVRVRVATVVGIGAMLSEDDEGEERNTVSRSGRDLALLAARQ